MYPDKTLLKDLLEVGEYFQRFPEVSIYGCVYIVSIYGCIFLQLISLYKNMPNLYCTIQLLNF